MQKIEDMSASEFAQIADHTLLASDTTAEQLQQFMSEAKDLGVKRVCISPSLLPVEKLGLEIVTVVGFPSGSHHKEIKAAETTRAIRDGADEIDMVANAALIHSKNWLGVEEEVAAVREACPGKVLKVILETAALNDEEIVGACMASERGGADYVKTSTGFHSAGGASVHAVKLMSDAVGQRLGVKASGGVRSAEQVLELAAIGATRFGVSGTKKILQELSAEYTPENSDQGIETEENGAY